MKLLLVIIITVLICFILFKNKNIEGLTNDEALKNIASLYNTQEMQVSNINVTNNATAKDVIVSDKVKTGKLQLGDKFLLSGVGDAQTNDTWLRLLGPTGNSYSGGLAAGKLYDESLGNTVKGYIDARADGLQGVFNNIGRVRGATQCASGWDLTGELQTGGMADCANQCRGRFPTQALCAQLRDNDNRCWCKSVLGFQPGVQNGWTAQLLI